MAQRISLGAKRNMVFSILDCKTPQIVVWQQEATSIIPDKELIGYKGKLFCTVYAGLFCTSTVCIYMYMPVHVYILHVGVSLHIYFL
jgi:hypothetical protein